MVFGALDNFLLIFIAVCLVLSLFGQWIMARAETKARMAILEFKIDRMLAHLGLEQGTPSEQVEELILRGMMLQAIKLYREQHGTGLRASKEAVEQMAAGMKAGLRQ
jgi:ribosomal protein L7/L12